MIEAKNIAYDGVRLAGTLFLPDSARGPVPAVVSAAGLGGVKDLVLPAFGTAFASAGIALLGFDYAGFGASEGEPRQHVSPEAQVEQFRRALDCLAADSRIDPERLGVSGISMAGGHTLRLTASDPRVRCAVAIAPFTTTEVSAPDPRLIAAVVADAEARARGEPAKLITLLGQPGEVAVLNTDGAAEWGERSTRAAASFRNEITLASLIELAAYRPAESAADIQVPMRLILGATDTITPASAARAALGKVVGLDQVELPGGHFDLIGRLLPQVVAATVEWFVEHLVDATSARPR
jgi:uncharacterized protein